MFIVQNLVLTDHKLLMAAIIHFLTQLIKHPAFLGRHLLAKHVPIRVGEPEKETLLKKI